MPKTDQFTISLKRNLRNKKVTQQQAADSINKSYRQFTREIRGETKLGIMSVDTVATLARMGLITEETIMIYWEETRRMLKFKKESPARSGAR